MSPSLRAPAARRSPRSMSDEARRYLAARSGLDRIASDCPRSTRDPSITSIARTRLGAGARTTARSPGSTTKDASMRVGDRGTGLGQVSRGFHQAELEVLLNRHETHVMIVRQHLRVRRCQTEKPVSVPGFEKLAHLVANGVRYDCGHAYAISFLRSGSARGNTHPGWWCRTLCRHIGDLRGHSCGR